MKNMKLYFNILFLLLTLTNCKSKKDFDNLKVESISELYNSGIDLLNQSKYSKAADKFSKIFFQHPGNALTPQAGIMQSYALYLDHNYDEALDVIENFISLHPLHEDISYAYYLRGLLFHMQISNVKLDQSKTQLAKESFEELITRFSNSKYAGDARIKLNLINEHLADKEMEIGRYYLKANIPIAAIKRYKAVVDNYQTTSHIEEALYRLALCYAQLGLLNESKKFAGILGNNYPDSKWHRYANNLLKDYMPTN